MTDKKEPKATGTEVAKTTGRPAMGSQNIIPVLDTAQFDAMARAAKMMAMASVIPEALRKGGGDTAIGNCFLVVNQAIRWGMDPFALAQCAFAISGKLGYEGKVAAAVINSDPRIEKRLDYKYSGEGDLRKVVVSATLAGEKVARTIEGTVGQWKTGNDMWKQDPDQMLAYRGARQWSRRHMPDVLLGVYTDDELIDMAERQDLVRQPDGTYAAPPRPSRDKPLEPADEAPAPPSEAVRATAHGAPPWPLVDETGTVDDVPSAQDFTVGLSSLFIDKPEHRDLLLENNAEGIARLRGEFPDLEQEIIATYTASKPEPAPEPDPEPEPEKEAAKPAEPEAPDVKFKVVTAEGGIVMAYGTAGKLFKAIEYHLGVADDKAAMYDANSPMLYEAAAGNPEWMKMVEGLAEKYGGNV